MGFHRLRLVLVLVLAAGTLAGCIWVVPPPHRPYGHEYHGYGPYGPPPPCRWIWVYGHWECR